MSLRAVADCSPGFSANGSSTTPDACPAVLPDHMPMTYAILWCENDGPEFAGRLSLEPAGVVLSGTAAGQPTASCDVSFDELADVYLERSAPSRHPWRPSLVLVTRAGDQLEIGSLQGLGALHELAEAVASRRSKAVA